MRVSRNSKNEEERPGGASPLLSGPRTVCSLQITLVHGRGLGPQRGLPCEIPRCPPCCPLENRLFVNGRPLAGPPGSRFELLWLVADADEDRRARLVSA